MKLKLLPKDNFKTGPKRTHYNDAGADVASTITTTLQPHQTIAIPLGYGIQLPDGYQAVVQPRSSLGKRGIVTQVAPIDSGYTGEIHAIVSNISDETYYIEEGDRIGQIVIMPIILADFVTDLSEERGDGSFGSSGK